MPIDGNLFVDKFAKELRESNGAIFAGAGLSKSAGYVDWPGLLKPMANELGLDISREQDLVALAQHYVNLKNGNTHELSQAILAEFGDARTPTENHKILARLPIKTFWTTNYDEMIEVALKAAGKRVDVKYSVEQLTTTLPKRDAVIYKMHGHVGLPGAIILTRSHYDSYYRTHEPFVTALSGALVSTTFLFIGFSFTDPNLQQVLGHIHTNFEQAQRTHYCIARKPKAAEFRSADEFNYATTKQALHIRELSRFNIETVLIEEYAELTDLLLALERAQRIKTVFISGSAVEFGAWGQERSSAFLSALARALVDRKFKITSGFGIGIGGPVVNGALQALYAQPTGNIDDVLTMRPFPIGIADEAQREETYCRYRDDLVSQAGIAIFAFGNKREDGVVSVADGMIAEYRLARDKGLWVLPLGATGHAAEKIWEMVRADYDIAFPQVPPGFREIFERLRQPTTDPMELLTPTLSAIEMLSDLRR